MKARLLATCALAAILAGCVIYTFPDLGPWDFDSATGVASPFSTNSTNPWVVKSSGGYDGSKCLTSATLSTSGASSTLTLTLDEGLDSDKDLHFYLKVSGGSVALRINGILEDSYNETTYSYLKKVDVYDSTNYESSGLNIITWTFTCDGSSYAYALLDEIKIDG